MYIGTECNDTENTLSDVDDTTGVSNCHYDDSNLTDVCGRLNTRVIGSEITAGKNVNNIII